MSLDVVAGHRTRRMVESPHSSDALCVDTRRVTVSERWSGWIVLAQDEKSLPV